MIITPREYLTVRLVVESDSSYQSIESSTIRGHPYCFYCIFDQINAALVSIRDSYQKHFLKNTPPPIVTFLDFVSLFIDRKIEKEQELMCRRKGKESVKECDSHSHRSQVHQCDYLR